MEPGGKSPGGCTCSTATTLPFLGAVDAVLVGRVLAGLSFDVKACSHRAAPFRRRMRSRRSQSDRKKARLGLVNGAGGRIGQHHAPVFAALVEPGEKGGKIGVRTMVETSTTPANRTARGELQR